MAHSLCERFGEWFTLSGRLGDDYLFLVEYFS